MKNNSSKCAKLYLSLKPDQQKRLLKWLHIEVDERQINLLSIFQLMMKGKSNDEIRKEIFPTDKNNEKLNKEMNKLTEYVIDFIVSEQIRKNNLVQKQKILIEYLYTHKLGLLNDHETTTLLKLAKDTNYRDETYHANMRLSYEYLQTQKLMFQPKTETDYSEDISKHETLYLIMSFLRYAIFAKNNLVGGRGIFEVLNVEKVIAVINEIPDIQTNEVIQFYAMVYRYAPSHSSEGIYHLINELINIRSFLPQETCIDFFRIILNCARKFISIYYDTHAYRVEWDLYMIGLEHDWVKLHNETSAVNYLNIVFTGVKLFTPDELWQQIEQNHLLTHAIYKKNEDVKILTESLILFEKKQYKEARTNIDNHTFAHQYYKLIGRLMRTKADYMTIDFLSPKAEDMYSNIADNCKYSYTKLEKARTYPDLSKEFRALYKLTFYKIEGLKTFYEDLLSCKPECLFPNRMWYVEAVSKRIDDFNQNPQHLVE